MKECELHLQDVGASGGFSEAGTRTEEEKAVRPLTTEDQSGRTDMGSEEEEEWVDFCEEEWVDF